jgi:cytoskeletal protein CcmA (bactofilin family)
MFGKTKDVVLPDELRSPAPVQQLQRFPATAPAAEPQSGNEISSISAGMTLTGKITGSGTVKILGRVQGELQASTVVTSLPRT